LSRAETIGIPVFLKLARRPAVIIGGGDEAAALASSLVAQGAVVTVVAMAASLSLHALAAADRIALLPRSYVRGDLAGAVLAACFEGGETAHAVASEASAERCLVHVADHPELSTFRFAEPEAPSAFTEEPA
jgi:siroheme synthase-like protein